MALYHKWYVKNDFAYVLQFFSLISDGLGGVIGLVANKYLHKICKNKWKFGYDIFTAFKMASL